jgi:mono/diheme cytochrome c family protein
MSALLMLMLVAIGIYGAWYPSRETDAEAHFEELTAERGSILFARNCRLCHGDVGEGGSLGARLAAAPALDRPDLMGFADATVKGTGGAADQTVVLSENVTAAATQVKITPAGSAIKGGSIILVDDERMEVTGVDGVNLTVKRGQGHTTAAAHSAQATVMLFDQATLTSTERLITNTIACGRVGTAMPAWAQIHGGPLSDEQIRQLMVVITQDYWEMVKHEVDIEDLRTELTAAVTDNATTIEVEDVTVFNPKDAIRIGDERMRVGSAVKLNGNAGILTVERGVLKSTPIDHAEGEEVFYFPEVAEPAINQASCGQTARAPQPTEPPGLIDSYTGNTTIEVVAQGVQFNTRTISAPANTSIRIRLDNQDAGVDHNIAFYQSATATTAPLVAGSIGTTFPGVAVDDTVFTTPAAGSYFFRCDVHPTSMTGTFSVQ